MRSRKLIAPDWEKRYEICIFNYEKTDRAEIQDGKARIVGVKDLETACTVANELIKEGVNCIELCGGFGSAGAKAIIEATGNEIPIGYITHLPEQDELYAKVFSKK